MRTNTATTQKSQVEVGYETSKFVMGTGMVLAALIGIWASACLISALVGGGVVTGFITAVTGV